MKYFIWVGLCFCLTLAGYEPKVEAFPFVGIVMDGSAGFKEWKDPVSYTHLTLPTTVLV